ncbi:MAG: hypothetical protein HZA19_03150 [Nitrospirae bacterium]|nr:hypothetical protein [Nitrospirota bacterium]
MKQHWLITRMVGKVFIVSGFLLAIYALEQSSTFLISLSVGLLGSGIAAMVATLYPFLKSRGPDRGPSAWKNPDR